MKILKVIILQAFWYLAVVYGHKYQTSIILLSLFILVLNYIFYQVKVSKAHYIFTLIFFILYGLVQESMAKKLGLVSYGSETFPFWLSSLYIGFLPYYGDIFNYLAEKSKYLLVAMGFIGGIAAFYSGSKISNIEVLSPYYYLLIGLSWGIFFPLSMKIFYEGFMWNKLLDTSIYFSFDKSGYLRHKKDFKNDLIFQKEAYALITGGTSGIGQAASLELAKQGVNVTITGRNVEKGEDAAKAHEKLTFISLDLEDWDSVQTKAATFSQASFDYIVLNAGGMPSDFKTNSQGVESQFASQLFGHYYLIKKLKEQGKLADKTKVVWVTSGGMYLSKLSLKEIYENEDYNKVSTYANVKRSQVELLDYFKTEFPEQIITAMHPGWVDTPGVSAAIPKFNEKMEGRLRSPLQGADTILWLLSSIEEDCKSSGSLYFDRKEVKKHFFWFTKTNQSKTKKLISILKQPEQSVSK